MKNHALLRNGLKKQLNLDRNNQKKKRNRIKKKSQ
jgi:hypothetical protein